VTQSQPHPILPNNQDRSRFVSEMFGRIASRYDLMNSVMTFGQDAWWRRLAVAAAAPPTDGVALDVGTGTGKVAFDLARRMTGGQVIASDFSEAMLRQGQHSLESTPEAHRVQFVVGDALHLPCPNASMDCVTSAFTVRNLTSAVEGFREMARVTRPGGRVVCLEITRLDNPLQRKLFGIYFSGLVPLIGRLISGDDSAYRYLPDSVDAFLNPYELAVQMREAGLAFITRRMLGMGTVTMLTGTKP
jgi:demethylmenaquinone methyltransferase/2-methoxy-6-polyprenyl-1,4-benzoquinol methylase